MNTHPIWSDKKDPVSFPALEKDLEVEVVVVGGGITGVSTAHLLARMGLKVALLERDKIGCGDTAHTTAHLTYMTDTRLSDIIHLCGRENARIAWAAGREAMDRIKRTAISLGIGGTVTEVPGHLVAREGEDLEQESVRLKKECEVASEMGFDVEYLDSIPPTGMPGIRFNSQLKFEPLDYLLALAKECQRLGVSIYEDSDVSEFGEEPDHLIANGHRVTYGNVVIASHVPLQGNRGTFRAALFQTKLSSYSTYAVAATAPLGSLPPMIWSDTADPFFYLRVDRMENHDRIILGGEDHKTGQVIETDRCFSKIEEELFRLLPSAKVTHRWSGQVVETVDGLPYIGLNAKGQFIATGFSGNGMTFGVVAAMMARDKIIGRKNGWEDAFDPARTELAALPNYLRENSDFPYLLVKDRLGIPKETTEQLEPGEGRILKVAGKNAAVCRDAKGNLHHLSAVCPHLGCIVAWNSSEETWDCPCHGSRFEPDGSLIAGPAETDLKPLKYS